MSITQFIVYALLVALAYVLRGLVFNFVWLVRMRAKYGRHAVYIFSPLMGVFGDVMEAYKRQVHPVMPLVERLRRDNNIHAKVVIAASILERQMLIIDPEYMKSFLVDKYLLYEKYKVFMIDRFIGEGLSFSEGAVWKRSRAQLSQLFHFNQLKNHVPTLLDLCKKHIEGMRDTREFKAGEGIDTLRLMQNVTGETILKRFFGCDVDQLDVPPGFNICHEVTECFGGLFGTEMEPQHYFKKLFFGNTYWLHPLFGENGPLSVLSAQKRNVIARTEKLEKVLLKLVEERIKAAETQTLSDCLLDVLVVGYIESRKTEPDFDGVQRKREIVHHCFSFLIGGIDTTSTLVTYCLYYLAKYPQMQAKMYEELKALNFLDSGDTDTLKKCEYTEMFLREALRHSGFLGGILMRNCVQEHYLGGEKEGDPKILIEKGVQVDVRTLIHMLLDENTDNPLEFDPERWEAEKVRKYHPFWAIPFSAGPRNCIGQHLSQIEIKLMLSSVLKNFVVELNPAVKMHQVQHLVAQPEDTRLNIFRPRK